MRVFNLILILSLTAAVALAQQSLKPGTQAPDFNAEALDGKVYNLSQLQGKVVVLTFWSTKCAICHSELPKLNEVARRYKDKDVVFLAATMENQVKIEPYLKKNQFEFNILPNSFGVVLKYADMDRNGTINMGFPSYFLINRHGTIALKSDGWDKTARLDTQISQLLASE
ncbi:MAG: TlpA family protein disulfide reductase [Acidobacteria bacterium]|nr:TlpA family protein disulfide reductase [Acidobacteriota bacterium]